MSNTPFNNNAAPFLHAWQKTGVALIALLTLYVLLYFSGLGLLVAMWEENGTYTHGYLIAPISLYLAWRARPAWLSVAPTNDWRWLIGVLASSLLWLVGVLADVVSLQHASVVFMLICIIPALFGRRATLILLFPILYLVFAIPFGESLLSPMMEFTADFTVGTLRLFGLPVYREGLFFTLPSGNWSVVEACSGLRYLIASLALGVLYAYLNYRSWRKRILFFIVSAIVPIIANGMRAVMIVLLGHWSGMKLAVGVDHYIYGWVFFMVVMFLLFWIGNFWREDTEPVALNTPEQVGELWATRTPRQLIAMVLVCALCMSLGPLTTKYLKNRVLENASSRDFSSFEQSLGTHQATLEFTPHFKNSRNGFQHEVQQNGLPLGWFVAHYSGQDNVRKLISVTNQIVVTTERQKQQLVAQRTYAAEDTHTGFAVRESELRLGGTTRVLAWHWYRVCQSNHANAIATKLAQIKCAITQGHDDGAVTLVYTVIENNQIEAARQRLSQIILERNKTLVQILDGKHAQPAH